MKKSILNLLLILIVNYFGKTKAITNDYPINFLQAVQNINKKLELAKYLKEQNHPAVKPHFPLNDFLFTSFNQINLANNQNLVQSSSLQNITQECMMQVISFITALTNRENWAIKGTQIFKVKYFKTKN